MTRMWPRWWRSLTEDLSHIWRHQRDLIRARKFIDEIEQQGGVQSGHPPNTVCMALWHAALISAIKCFQNSELREKLKADDVFGRDRTQSVRADFDLLKNMRNKHVSHDENNWMTPVPYANVHKPGHQTVLGDVDCMVVEGMDTANIERLGTVVDTALAWVGEKYGQLREAIRSDLLSRSYDDLMALPMSQFNTPYRDSVARPRPNSKP